MQLSKRLSKIAVLIEYKTIADIGTDHALIPIFAIESKIAEKAIASDYNFEPLKIGKQNIKKHGYENIIETRQGSGLKTINKGEVETAIIAGMGGLLIIDILKESIETVKSLKQIILQPQLHVEQLRRFLHSNDIIIRNEEIVFEDDKYYNILNCTNGTEKYNDLEYKFGKYLMDTKNELLKKKLEFELSKIERIYNDIDSKNENSIIRKKELESEIKEYYQALKCF